MKQIHTNIYIRDPYTCVNRSTGILYIYIYIYTNTRYRYTHRHAHTHIYICTLEVHGIILIIIGNELKKLSSSWVVWILLHKHVLGKGYESV